MNFGFVVRSSKQPGGDLVAVNTAAAGIKNLGHRVFFGHSVQDVYKSDYIFLTNSCLDLRPLLPEIRANGKMRRFGIFTFQEDFNAYFHHMMGFCSYVTSAFNKGKLKNDVSDVKTSIEYLKDDPDVALDWAGGQDFKFSPTIIVNRKLTEGAESLFVHSEKEKNYFNRRVPAAKPTVARWAPGIIDEEGFESDDSFLKLTGLTKGEYVLSVGRLEGRKNQLASLLALYDSDHTMVLTTQSVYSAEFVELIMDISAKRKGDTIIVSQDLPSKKEGNLTVIGLGGDLLPDSTLGNAFENAGLHLHPAYYEMPGLTYLEAAHYNIPQVASSWTSIDEYFALGGSPTLDGRVEYVEPNNIRQIEEAVNKQFGKTFEPLPPHPALTRTKDDLARDILDSIIR